MKQKSGWGGWGGRGADGSGGKKKGGSFKKRKTSDHLSALALIEEDVLQFQVPVADLVLRVTRSES